MLCEILIYANLKLCKTHHIQLCKTPVSRNTAPATPAAPAPNIDLSCITKDRIDVFSQLMPVMQAVAA